MLTRFPRFLFDDILGRAGEDVEGPGPSNLAYNYEGYDVVFPDHIHLTFLPRDGLDCWKKCECDRIPSRTLDVANDIPLPPLKETLQLLSGL